MNVSSKHKNDNIDIENIYEPVSDPPEDRMTRYRPPEIDLYDINAFLSINEDGNKKRTAFLSDVVDDINKRLYISKRGVCKFVQKWTDYGIFVVYKDEEDKIKLAVAPKYLKRRDC